MCNATCLHKLSFDKLAEQQIPYQACKLAPVKRDTGNATIHRNGTKPAPFFWKRGSHCNALCLVRFHRATAENETSDKQTLVWCLFVSLCAFSLWRLAARSSSGKCSNLRIGSSRSRRFCEKSWPKDVRPKTPEIQELVLGFWHPSRADICKAQFCHCALKPLT